MKGKKGQTTIPKNVRDRHPMGPGTEVEFGLREDGAYIDPVRGGSYEELTARKSRPRRRESK